MTRTRKTRKTLEHHIDRQFNREIQREKDRGLFSPQSLPNVPAEDTSLNMLVTLFCAEKKAKQERLAKWRKENVGKFKARPINAKALPRA